MDRFGPTGKVSKKLVHLLRWTTFPGRNFGCMDRALSHGRGLGLGRPLGFSIAGGVVIGGQMVVAPSPLGHVTSIRNLGVNPRFLLL